VVEHTCCRRHCRWMQRRQVLGNQPSDCALHWQYKHSISASIYNVIQPRHFKVSLWQHSTQLHSNVHHLSKKQFLKFRKHSKYISTEKITPQMIQGKLTMIEALKLSEKDRSKPFEIRQQTVRTSTCYTHWHSTD